MEQGISGAPDAVRQHAPVGAGWGQVVFEHVVPAPRHVPCDWAHPDSVVTRHVTAVGPVMQHAPVGVGVGQGFEVQVVATPAQVPPSAVQLVCVRIVQCATPLEVMQHAPVALVVEQVLFAPQAESAPSHVPCASAHAACVITEHVSEPAAFPMQHAPVGSNWPNETFADTSAAPQHSAAATLPMTRPNRDVNISEAS
jgi:hypothetical protein